MIRGNDFACKGSQFKTSSIINREYVQITQSQIFTQNDFQGEKNLVCLQQKINMFGCKLFPFSLTLLCTPHKIFFRFLRLSSFFLEGGGKKHQKMMYDYEFTANLTTCLQIRHSPPTIRTAKPNIMDGFRCTKDSSQAIPQIRMSRTYCLFPKLIEMKEGWGLFHGRFGVKFKNLFYIKMV